ncbi:MAG TPA: hypothetical protein H9905_05260, partial [Candidatus Faecalibacterium intestinipullorum]|nr:hypothetical protein [Candidatus Faecalibacterium intestinipullorum]
KLEMMADTLFEQLLGDKHQIIQTALELLKKYYRESSRKDQQGNSERKIQLERIDTRLRNLTVMRADGEIGKEEYQQLRDQLEAEKSRLEEEQKKAESVECREAMDLDRIQQALEELVHLKGKGVSRELVDQIVYRVTPVSETHFEWYLHLGPGTDAQASLLVEGKKGNCVPSVKGIREFLNPSEVKTDVAANQILGSLPAEQLPRRPSRTPARNLARPSAPRAGCPPCITNPPAQKWAVFFKPRDTYGGNRDARVAEFWPRDTYGGNHYAHVAVLN